MPPPMNLETVRTLLAITLWKLTRNGQLPDGINITNEDIDAFQKESDAETAVLFHHWHKTSVDLKIVSKADGDRLARLHVEQTGGTARYTPPSKGPPEGN